MTDRQAEEYDSRLDWFSEFLLKQKQLFFHRQPIEPENTAAYWRLLRKYSDDEIKKAFKACLTKKKHPGLPMPAEVAEEVRLNLPPAPPSDEPPPMTPEEARRQRAWAALCAWTFKRRRIAEMGTAESRRKLIDDFEDYCRQTKGKEDLVGAIDPEAEQ